MVANEEGETSGKMGARLAAEYSCVSESEGERGEQQT